MRIFVRPVAMVISVVNLQLRCGQLTVTLNCNQKMRLYAIDPIVSVV